MSPVLYIRSHLRQTLLWVAAVLIVILGVTLSRIGFKDQEWLSRAGCLIVMLGIWSGLGVVVQERLIRQRIKRQRRNAVTEARARLGEEGKCDEEVHQEIEEINVAFDRREEELTHQLKFSLGILEVSLLITGTFLWGFGDLFV